MSLSRDPDDPAEPHELLSIGAFERATLLCSASGDRNYSRVSGNRAFLNRVLSLENYNPLTGGGPAGSVTRALNGASDTQRVLNYACNWDALDLPENPLQLCCFDVVLLADGALGRLGDVRLQALSTWIEAGGSLCVLPDDNRLTNSHLQFLQTLFERASDPSLHLSITDKNELLVISDETDPIVNRRFGLGRVTLLPNLKDLPARLTGAELGTVVGHLWKARKDSGIFGGEPWRQSDIERMLVEQGYSVRKVNTQYRVEKTDDQTGRRQTGRFTNLEDAAQQYGLNYELQPKNSPLGSSCETALMPQGVEMVPTSVIALLLIAYVVTIGPVDYIVLGWFRARKYTWVLFPIVTAAFTGLTVSIAHHYMASTDTGGRMSVVDVVEDGRPVRQTDLQMHFYASQTTLRKEASQAFVVPAQMASTDLRYGGQQGPRSINRQIHYAGRFPQTFSVSQSMRQWEPQLNRSMTFTPDAPGLPGIPWDDPEVVTTEEGRLKLGEILRQKASDAQLLDAIVLHGTERLPIRGDDGFLFSRSLIQQGESWTQLDVWQRQYQRPPSAGVASVGILESSARTGTRDFFSIVFQVSPQGSASMEDLPVLDPSDPDQWLLLVAVSDGTDTTVYRRLHDLNQTH